MMAATVERLILHSVQATVCCQYSRRLTCVVAGRGTPPPPWWSGNTVSSIVLLESCIITSCTIAHIQSMLCMASLTAAICIRTRRRDTCVLCPLHG